MTKKSKSKLEENNIDVEHSGDLGDILGSLKDWKVGSQKFKDERERIMIRKNYLK